LRRRRTGALGPGGKVLFGGLGAVIVLFVVVQFIIPFFFSRTDSPTQSTTKPENKIVITGQVLDAVNGFPIPGATIVAGSNKLALVDATGTFTITEQLPQGPVNVIAPGYVAATLPAKSDKAFAVQLQPNKVSGVLLDADTQKPLAGKMVRYGDAGIITDENGQFTLFRVSDSQKLSVGLIGYEKIEQSVDLTKLDSPISLTIRSTQLNSTILDAETGKGVPNALITVADSTGTTDRQGKFSINDAPRTPGLKVKVRAPGYRIQTFAIEDAFKGIKLVPFHLQAVYVPGILALKPNYDKLFTPFLEMGRQGKINAIVVDVKHDDTGKLLYDSKIPLANNLKLVYDLNRVGRGDLIDVPRLLKDAHAAGLYVIARMVAYRDPGLATAKPEWALKNRNTGQPWKDASDLVWPNPSIPEVGDYIVDIAKEVSGLGFDEVQFDYIRFPTDGKLLDVDYGGGLSWSVLGKAENEKMRTSVIERTVKKAYEYLRTTDTYLSLDVFGYSLWLADDVGIGQQYNNLVMTSDYVCPMIYPSHFDPGTEGYANPGLYPGEIIGKSGKISNQIESKLPTVARYRPWLEDFSRNWGPAKLQYKNTPERVKTQIEAALTNGASGFTLWNATGNYTTSAIPNAKTS